MAFPAPIFVAGDWLAVWIFPTIMAVVFGLLFRDPLISGSGDRRPLFQRFASTFVLYASVWIPFKIVSDAVERGAVAQGFSSAASWGWGFGAGLVSGFVFFLALMAVSATMKPVEAWLGFNRNPFKGAGKS